jgi:hypothetical protein
LFPGYLSIIGGNQVRASAPTVYGIKRYSGYLASIPSDYMAATDWASTIDATPWTDGIGAAYLNGTQQSVYVVLDNRSPIIHDIVGRPVWGRTQCLAWARVSLQVGSSTTYVTAWVPG